MSIKTEESTLYERVEAWLNDDLGPAENAVLTMALLTDPELSALADRYFHALQAIRIGNETEMQRKISAWKQNMEQLPEPPRNPGLRPGKWAAGLLGLGFLLIILPFNGQPGAPQQTPGQSPDNHGYESRDTAAFVPEIRKKVDTVRKKINNAQAGTNVVSRRALSIEPDAHAGVRYETRRVDKTEAAQILHRVQESRTAQIDKMLENDSDIEMVIALSPPDALPFPASIVWPYYGIPGSSSE